MFLEILIAVIIGVIAGTFTGLVPGIHVNLVAVLLVSYSAKLIFLGHDLLAVFIVSMSMTHTFISTIPSIFLGAPEGSTALSVLPGHALLLEGKGFEAVKLTIIGSVIGLFLATFLFLVLKWVISEGYPFIKNFIAELLMIVAIFVILRSTDKKRSTTIFLLAGTLGVLVLRSRLENALFPLLTGFFGVSTLLFSLQSVSKVPPQNLEETTEISFKNSFSSSVLGMLSGFVTAVLPGLGSSTAATIGSLFKKESDRKDFLVMIGSISTVNFFMSLAAMITINKARNGSIIAIMSIAPETSIYLLLLSAIMSGGISVIVALQTTKFFSKIINKINYVLLVKTIIFMLLILTLILSGFIGLYVLLVSCLLGLYTAWKGLPRNILMACIMVPVMLFFL